MVIVEMMMGEFPYSETKDFLAMLDQIKETPSPNVPQNGNFSPELHDFIEQCLKKDPKDRYSEVQLMAHPWILKYS